MTRNIFPMLHLMFLLFECVLGSSEKRPCYHLHYLLLHCLAFLISFKNNKMARDNVTAVIFRGIKHHQLLEFFFVERHIISISARKDIKYVLSFEIYLNISVKTPFLNSKPHTKITISPKNRLLRCGRRHASLPTNAMNWNGSNNFCCSTNCRNSCCSKCNAPTWE